MSKNLFYLHYGAQCPGYRYMGSGARQMADALDRNFYAVDVRKTPCYAHQHQMFFPGMIVLDDFSIVYPGTVEEMLLSYRLKGPVPGEMAFNPRVSGLIDEVKSLTADTCSQAAEICLGTGTRILEGIERKGNWISAEAETLKGGTAGLLGFTNDNPIAGVEFVLESRVPYPITHRRAGWIFITCLYSSPSSEDDYRPDMLNNLLKWARKMGYQGISAVSGRETPYPNGPLSTFQSQGFSVVESLGQVLLKHKWEPIHFTEKRFI